MDSFPLRRGPDSETSMAEMASSKLDRNRERIKRQGPPAAPFAPTYGPGGPAAAQAVRPTTQPPLAALPIYGDDTVFAAAPPQYNPGGRMPPQAAAYVSRDPSLPTAPRVQSITPELKNNNFVAALPSAATGPAAGEPVPGSFKYRLPMFVTLFVCVVATLELSADILLLSHIIDTADACRDLGEINNYASTHSVSSNANQDEVGTLEGTFCQLGTRLDFYDPRKVFDSSGNKLEFCYNVPNGVCSESDPSSTGPDQTGIRCGGRNQTNCPTPLQLQNRFVGSGNVSCKWTAIPCRESNCENARSILASDIELIQGYDPLQCAYFRLGSTPWAKESVRLAGRVPSLTTLYLVANVFLMVIIMKEVLKGFFVVASLFSTYNRRPHSFKFADNSPIMLLFLFSKSYRRLNRITYHHMRAEVCAMDILLQQTPQLLIPMWVLHGNDWHGFNSLMQFSLVMAAMALLINLFRMIQSIGHLGPVYSLGHALTIEENLVLGELSQQLKQAHVQQELERQRRSCTGRMMGSVRAFAVKHAAGLVFGLALVHTIGLVADFVFLEEVINMKCPDDGVFPSDTRSFCSLQPPVMLARRESPGQYRPCVRFSSFDSDTKSYTCSNATALASIYPKCSWYYTSSDCTVALNTSGDGTPFTGDLSTLTAIQQGVGDFGLCNQGTCAYFTADALTTASPLGLGAFQGSTNSVSEIQRWTLYILIAIVVKECWKVSILLGSFVSQRLKEPGFLKYTTNSPLSAVFVCFHQGTMEVVQQILHTSEPQTWVLGLDLFVQHIPVVGISAYVLSDNGWASITSFTRFSLIMSIIAINLNLARFLSMSVHDLSYQMGKFKKETSVLERHAPKS